MTTTKSNSSTGGQGYPSYAGSGEVWPLPWQLSPDQLELRDANGFTVLKAWNGHANILYAHKAVNAFAELERERDALRLHLGNILQCFRNGAMPHRDIVEAAEAALGGNK
jgi:hypothetical protein